MSEPAEIKLTRRDICDMKTELLEIFPLYPIPETVIDYQDGFLKSHRNGYGYDCDYLATIFAFRDRRWDQVHYPIFIAPVANAKYTEASYYFLTTEAFRYYFPAWIQMALDMPEHAQHIYDAFCDVLNINKYHENQHSLFISRFVSFTRTQKKLIARSLRYIACVAPEFLGHDPATPAYNAYWAQFDDKTGAV